jgi:hypothetical protein
VFSKISDETKKLTKSVLGLPQDSSLQVRFGEAFGTISYLMSIQQLAEGFSGHSPQNGLLTSVALCAPSYIIIQAIFKGS